MTNNKQTFQWHDWKVQPQMLLNMYEGLVDLDSEL